MVSEYIEQRNGGYYVAGTRISLDSVVYSFNGGPSVITSKPAIHDHFKTGQGKRTQDKNFCTAPEVDLASDSSDAHRQGDRARGISAERFEIPLAGGGAASMGASAVGWRPACAAWGEPARPGFPRRGNGKGATRFLAAAG